MNRSISCYFQVWNIIFRNHPDQNTGNGMEMPGIWMAKNIKILHQDWPPGHLPKYDTCLVVWILMFLQFAGKTMPIWVAGPCLTTPDNLWMSTNIDELCNGENLYSTTWLWTTSHESLWSRPLPQPPVVSAETREHPVGMGASLQRICFKCI